MTEGTSLDDLLNPAEPVEEAVSEAVEETQSERPRDETGKFVSTKGVEAAEPEGDADAVVPTDPLPKEEYQAVKKERERRQAIEREVETLKAQINQLTQEPPAPPPSVWEDEQGYSNNIVNTAVAQAEFRAGVKMSEMLMRQAEPQFDELKALYLQLEKENPALIPQVMNDPHPWNKAIQIAKNHKAMQDLGATNVDDLREKLKAELLAELQQGSSSVAGKPAIPATLTGERSVAGRTGPEWSGPTPLSSLLR